MNIEKLSKADKGLYVNAPRVRKTCGKEGNYERTTVQIPTALMRRFDRKTKGGKGLCLELLLEYAMNSLEKNGEIIIVLD